MRWTPSPKAPRSAVRVGASHGESLSSGNKTARFYAKSIFGRAPGLGAQTLTEPLSIYIYIYMFMYMLVYWDLKDSFCIIPHGFECLFRE